MTEVTEAALEKRREIVLAAARLFDEKGYANTSMKEVAQASGMHKPTLYHYFASKDAILFEIHDQLMDHLQRQLDVRRAEHRGRAVLALRATIHDLLAAFASHPGFPRVFTEAHRELPEGPRAVVAAKRDLYAEQFEALIAEAQAGGEIRDLDPKLTRLSVLGMASWAYHWLDTDGWMSVDEVAEFMWDLVFSGMRPRP